MTINFQRLMDVAKATELLPLGIFRMDVVCVEHHCGTAGCMIGNYNAMAGRHKSIFSWAIPNCGALTMDDPRCDWHHFGITEKEYNWLFGDAVPLYKKKGVEYVFHRDLPKVSRDQALSRLRKFIYYKLRKNEFIVDEKYGIREEARHAEGSHNFAVGAKREAADRAVLVGV